ncbi:MAG: hypothetical protein QM677_09410 [Microbacterium sp.]
MHVGAASGMLVLFAIFVTVAFLKLPGAFLKLPGVPRDFLILTGAVVLGIIVAITLWVPIGYDDLTGLEVVAATLMFLWLMAFARNVSAYGARGRAASDPVS